MNYRLPGPDFGGLKSFAFQLVSDEQGAPLILSNEVIELYLGYCTQCRTEHTDPLNFLSWINSDEDAELSGKEDTANALATDAVASESASLNTETVSGT